MTSDIIDFRHQWVNMSSYYLYDDEDGNPVSMLYPANTEHSHNAVSMLGHRRRRWANIETALSEWYPYNIIVNDTERNNKL